MTDSSDPVSVEALLLQSGWVRGVALSLVSDPGDADDLIHETWLRALRHPPDRRGELRSWFRRVMVNLHRQNRRSAGARAQREAAVARGRTPMRPDELVERADTLRRLAGHVVALPEPYRHTILMRHFEELPPAAISARTGTPVETVRTHIKRGYALLRERLEAENGPDWPLALLPLIRWPPAPDALVPPASPPRRAPRTATVAAACIGAAVVVASLLWPSQDDPPDVASRPTRSAPASAPPAGHPKDGGRATAAGDSDAAPAPRPSATPPADPPRTPAGTVSLTGTLETDAGPPPGVARLHMTALVVGQTLSGLETLDLTAAGGAVAVDLPLADRSGRRVIEWDVRIDHPDYMPLSTRVRMPLPSNAVTTVAMDPIRLQRAGHVTGSVAFEPAASGDVATVGTIPLAGTYASPYDTVTAAPGARFRVRALPGAKMLVAAVANDRCPAAREIHVDAGSEKEVGVLVLAEGVRISGRVGTRPRFPLAQKPTVSIIAPAPRPFAFPLGERFIGWDGTVAWTYQVWPPVDPDGRFTAGGLLPGTFQLQDNATTGVPRRLQTETLKPFEAPTENADFEYSGTLVRVLVRRGGAPAPGAVVGLGGTGGAVTGDDGVARFIGRPGATYTVEVRVTGSAPVELKIAVPADGEAEPVTVDLPDPAALPATATWAVTIRPSSGEAPRVASFGFHVTTGGPFAAYPEFTRDAAIEDGVFRVKDIPPGRWRVEVRPGAKWHDPSSFLVAAPLEREFAPGEAASDTVPASPGGRLVLSAFEADGSRADRVTCRVLDAAHAEVPVSVGILRIGATQFVSGTRAQVSPFAPTDVYAALPPGHYSVEFEQNRGGPPVRATATVEILAGKAAEAAVRFPPR